MSSIQWFTFATGAAIFCAGTIWVYLRIRQRQAAITAVLLGAALSIGPFALHVTATQVFGISSTFKIIGDMGAGLGIFVGGVFGLVFGALSSGNTADGT